MYNYENIGKQLIVAQKSLRHCIQPGYFVYFLCVCERRAVLFPVERVFSSLHAELLHVCAAHRMFYHHFFNIAFGMSQIRPRPYICHPPPRIFPRREIYLFGRGAAAVLFRRQKREMEKEVRSDFALARAPPATRNASSGAN